MSEAKKTQIGYPLGIAESVARVLANWVSEVEVPVLVQIESEAICHGLLRVKISYSPAIDIHMTLLERGSLKQSSGDWVVCDGWINFFNQKNRVKESRLFDPNVLRSLKYVNRMRDVICDNKVEGEVRVYLDKQARKAYRRTYEEGREDKMDKNLKVEKFPFKNVNEFQLAQLAAAALVTEFEASIRRKNFEKRLKGDKNFSASKKKQS